VSTPNMRQGVIPNNSEILFNSPKPFVQNSKWQFSSNTFIFFGKIPPTVHDSPLCFTV